MGYFSNTRIEMIDFIPGGCKRILEVGCGEGAFGLLVKKRLQSVEYWGIESDPASVLLAKEKIDHVIMGDFFTEADTLKMNYFDCVVLNDVLEHFIDPWKALSIINRLLSENGYIVCSIPNVRYVGNLHEMIIKKDWEYKSSGLLDKSHYRFFTEKSILRLFKQSGFTIMNIHGINPTKSIKVWLFIFFTFGFFRDIRYQQFGLTAIATTK